MGKSCKVYRAILNTPSEKKYFEVISQIFGIYGQNEDCTYYLSGILQDISLYKSIKSKWSLLDDSFVVNINSTDIHSIEPIIPLVQKYNMLSWYLDDEHNNINQLAYSININSEYNLYLYEVTLRISLPNNMNEAKQELLEISKYLVQNGYLTEMGYEYQQILTQLYDLNLSGDWVCGRGQYSIFIDSTTLNNLPGSVSFKFVKRKKDENLTELNQILAMYFQNPYFSKRRILGFLRSKDISIIEDMLHCNNLKCSMEIFINLKKYSVYQSEIFLGLNNSERKIELRNFSWTENGDTEINYSNSVNLTWNEIFNPILQLEFDIHMDERLIKTIEDKFDSEL